MLKLLSLSIVQCLLLSSGQILLKAALEKMLPFGWNRDFWYSLFGNWQFGVCCICFGTGSLLWMYILKHFPLSMAYPLTSLSYIISMVAAILFFHEVVPLYRWIGCILIIAGCFLILK